MTNIEELFLNRIYESNAFSKNEINVIKNKLNLFEKCYLLGIIDTKY